jgi:hypothetical protein
VLEISRRPLDFCSGRGAVSIPDMPEAAMEFFGSFINMDDPRHARQRGIVSCSFTPRQLAKVLDSVETICTEVIDGFCEAGEVDLVEVLSRPFPLLIICDMMGIPRSEFDTVLEATNVILGGGDPEFFAGGDPMTVTFEAGIQLTQLMNGLADERRREPTDDLTSKLVHADLGEEMLAPQEVAPFFILLAVAGNDTTRTDISHGMQLLSEYPDRRAIWQGDQPPRGLRRPGAALLPGSAPRPARAGGRVPPAPDPAARHRAERRPGATRVGASRWWVGSSGCPSASPRPPRWEPAPGGSVGRCPSRCASSPSPSSGPPTTTSWRWRARRRRSASTRSSARTTT